MIQINNYSLCTDNSVIRKKRNLFHEINRSLFSNLHIRTYTVRRTQKDKFYEFYIHHMHLFSLIIVLLFSKRTLKRSLKVIYLSFLI